ncbi:MAG: serine/threonine protein kinase, partial [Planctomycetota bacterium]
LLGSGAAVGALAFFVMNALMIPADSLSIYRDVLEGESLPSALYSDDTFPRMSAFMAHFALLFALLRWWRNTDPLRRKRFSVFAVFAAVAGEWVLHQFLPIPQPWGMLIAGGLAVTTQVASPWIDSKERLNTEIAA